MPLIDERYLTGPPITKDYSPPSQSWTGYLYDPSRPLFTQLAIEAMLNDPRVMLGMALLKGPITSDSRFYVDCEHAEAKKYIASQIQRLFNSASIDTSLDAMQYGRQPAETMWRSKGGYLQFDQLRYIQPRDATAVAHQGQLVGMRLNNIEGAVDQLYVGGPKCFWSVHNRNRNRWYGDSRLRGAFMPWYEKWALRGYRDQRQLWFFKCAFQGPKVYYPPGSQAPVMINGQPNPNGIPTDNKLKALEIGDRWASGCTIALEASPPGINGMPSGWEVVEPTSNAAPEGLLQYGHDLDNEIWEGLEIPPEIASAQGGGGGQGITIGGQGGRDVPQQAFFSILQRLVLSTISDFDEQVIRYGVDHNFGPGIDYDIECFGLSRDEERQAPPMFDQTMPPEAGADPNAQGDQQPGQGQPQQSQSPIQMSALDILPFRQAGVVLDAESRDLYHLRRHSAWNVSVGHSA